MIDPSEPFDTGPGAPSLAAQMDARGWPHPPVIGGEDAVRLLTAMGIAPANGPALTEVGDWLQILDDAIDGYINAPSTLSYMADHGEKLERAVHQVRVLIAEQAAKERTP